MNDDDADPQPRYEDTNENRLAALIDHYYLFKFCFDLIQWCSFINLCIVVNAVYT